MSEVRYIPCWPQSWIQCGTRNGMENPVTVNGCVQKREPWDRSFNIQMFEHCSINRSWTGLEGQRARSHLQAECQFTGYGTASASWVVSFPPCLCFLLPCCGGEACTWHWPWHHFTEWIQTSLSPELRSDVYRMAPTVDIAHHLWDTEQKNISRWPKGIEHSKIKISASESPTSNLPANSNLNFKCCQLHWFATLLLGLCLNHYVSYRYGKMWKVFTTRVKVRTAASVSHVFLALYSSSKPFTSPQCPELSKGGSKKSAFDA